MLHIDLVRATRRKGSLLLGIEGTEPRRGKLSYKYGWLTKMPRISITKPGKYIILHFGQIVEAWRKRL